MNVEPEGSRKDTKDEGEEKIVRQHKDVHHTFHRLKYFKTKKIDKESILDQYDR